MSLREVERRRIVVHDVHVQSTDALGGPIEPRLIVLVGEVGPLWLTAPIRRMVPGEPAGTVICFGEVDGFVSYSCGRCKVGERSGYSRRATNEIVEVGCLHPQLALRAGFPAVVNVTAVERQTLHDGELWWRHRGVACGMTTERVRSELAIHDTGLDLVAAPDWTFLIRRRSGWASTLPGYRVDHGGGICVCCGARSQVLVLLDSNCFRSERQPYCSTCADLRDVRSAISGTCEFCPNSGVLVPTRCIDEGAHGRLYWVCGDCSERSDADARATLNECQLG